jgi:hypothetical protein
MARIPTHTLDTVPEGSRDGLKILHDRFGKILNIQRALAHAPVALKTYLALKDILHNEDRSTHAPSRPSRWSSPRSTAAPIARRPTPWAAKPPA